MISCKHAAFLDTKKSFNALSVIEKMRLKLHVKVCEACRSLGEDSELIDKAVEKILAQKASQKISLSDEQRRKILTALPLSD